jgi:hypothetical protein
MIGVFTHVIAFVLGFVAAIAVKLFWWLFETGRIKKGVKLALNTFTTLWDAFLKDKPPNIGSFSWEYVKPILGGVPDIKELIMSKPVTLANLHLKEASAIADESILIIEQQKRLSDSRRYGTQMVSRKDIDELAKRARKCAEELERWWGKK